MIQHTFKKYDKMYINILLKSMTNVYKHTFKKYDKCI